MKSIMLRILGIFLFFLIVKIVFDNINRIIPQKDVNKELRQDSLAGIVVLIDQGRGFKIQLDNSKRYTLYDAYNADESKYLIHLINWGDSVYKKSNSDTLYLRRKANGEILKFWLYLPTSR